MGGWTDALPLLEPAALEVLDQALQGAVENVRQRLHERRHVALGRGLDTSRNLHGIRDDEPQRCSGEDGDKNADNANQAEAETSGWHKRELSGPVYNRVGLSATLTVELSNVFLDGEDDLAELFLVFEPLLGGGGLTQGDSRIDYGMELSGEEQGRGLAQLGEAAHVRTEQR